MKNTRMDVQEDLFEPSKSRELKRQVKELDRLIARALKQNNYSDAKKMADQQSKIIQELVAIHEKKDKHQSEKME